jgi:hypothetical protein
MTKKSKYDMPAVQNFAFGGIANPSQRTMIRGSDKQYFDARQKELDAFEAQRVAYNDSLTKWQNEVYTPYKAQIAEYNTAVDAYNAGPRTTDYTGPAMPTPGREFDGTAPTVPFKEEDVKARQQAAAMRARNDAAARATAIDVASDPSRFNFGSMSVSNRFMAEGGEVTQDDSRDKAASSVIKDFESYGYTKKEIMALADEVAAAGRGGDELLAYLSPESVELLKANGGAGTTNPVTGLPEFLSPVLGGISEALKQGIMEEQAKQAAADKAASDAAAAAEAARLAELQKTSVMKDPGQIGKQPYRSDAFPAYFFAKEALEAQQERDRMAVASAEELLRQAQERERMIAAPVIGTNRTPVASIAQPSFQSTPQFSFANSPSPNFSGNASVPQSMVRDSTNSYAPVNAQDVPTYSSRGVGAISSIGSARDMATSANRNLSPVVLGSTQNANNLSPTMLGGAQNAGFFTDRLGNQIYAPGMGPVSTPRYAKGGDVDLKALLAQNTETMSNEEPEEATNTNPVGTAQKMLADLGGAGQASPTRQAIKRVRTAPGGGATSDKAMQMAYEALSKGDLSAMKDVTPAARNTDSARAQMEELARIYQMKIRATQEKAKGLSADTFGAPTLEGPTLTKGKLTKKRFKDGGEAKKSSAVADIGKWLKNNDINPSDFLAALGRVSAVAGSALTPSTLNEGEDAELARRRTMPPTVTRAEGSPEEGETSIKDRLIGAGETALTLGTGALSSVVGMPYGLYKGVTSGKYLEGKAPQIADKEAAAFIERNTYIPRSETGRENLEKLSRLMEQSKLPPIIPEAVVLQSIPRAAVASQVERTGMAAEKALEKPLTDVLKKGGKGAEMLKALSAPPSYAVRPTGSTTSMNNPAVNSKLERLIADGLRGDGIERTTDGIENFWNVKARNYFEKQFGTPNDPVAEGLKTGRIKSGATQDTAAFPSYLTDQLTVGKTRTREGERPAAAFVGPGAPATRFFPKYPQAMEEFTARYDTATGLKGNLISKEPGMGHETYPNMLSPLGETRAIQSRDTAREMLAAQGVRDELANPNIELTARSETDPTQSTGYSPQAKELLEAYEKSKEKPSILSRLGLTPEAEPAKTLSQSVLTAIEKGEPIYDTTGIKPPLKSLFDPAKINKYLETLPERELKNVRFEDVVQGANKMFAEQDTFKALADRIRSGKSVPDKVFSDGVSSPLLQFDKKSGFDGFAWKRLETPESTVPEGAYLGHSVGGYKLGGPTYSKEKMQGFKEGRYEVYTLRDNRNRPVTTVEVQMLDEVTPAVLQIKGNGRATGNVPAENYDRLVLDFFENYLNPVQISEKDALLTPLLQQYKEGINANFKMP